MKLIALFLLLTLSFQSFAASSNNQTFQFDLSNSTTYGTGCTNIPSANQIVVICKNANTVVANNALPDTKLVPVDLLFLSPSFQFVGTEGFNCYIIPRDTTPNNFHVFCL